MVITSLYICMSKMLVHMKFPCPFIIFFLERFLLLILTNKKYKDVFSFFAFEISKEIGDVLQVPPDPGAEYKPRLKPGNFTDEFL